MTILYKRDWQDYPTAVIHDTTKNESFLVLADKYKRMGIENHYFHLALIQPELASIDPHDPDLDVATMIKIAQECEWNPWYFWREVFPVPPTASIKPLPLLANRGNIAVYWCFLNQLTVANVQPRQTGKSLNKDGVSSFGLYCGANNTQFNLVTLSEKLRKANIERLKKIRDFLPKYISKQTPEDSDNKEDITCRFRGNVYQTHIAQTSSASATNQGRGLTSPWLEYDEFGVSPNVQFTYPAIVSAGDASRAEAIKHGGMVCRLLTTTAGMRDTEHGEYAFNLIHDGFTWSEKLFDCYDRKEMLEVVKNNMKGKAVLINCTFSHRQLGYTDEWLIERINEAPKTRDQIERDYLNVWTSGNESSIFDSDLAAIIRKSECDPVYTQLTPEKYLIHWYVAKNEIESYMTNNVHLIGLDGSDAVGRDNITLVFTNTKTLEVTARVTLNETNILKAANFISDLLIKYPKTILIPESKSSGRSICDICIVRLSAAGFDPFKRIFNIVVNESAERETDWRIVQTDHRRRPTNYLEIAKKFFGFSTGASGHYSRHVLYNEVILHAAKIAGYVVRDKVLIDELLGLKTKNGRVDHQSGKHDDHVIAWLLCAWFLIFGRNHKFYGIEGALSQISTNRSSQVDDIDEFNIIEQQEQDAIRKEIDNLLERIKKTSDDNIVLLLENRVRTLDSRLKESYSTAVSIDSLLKEVKNNRLKQNRDQRRLYDSRPTQGPNMYF